MTGLFPSLPLAPTLDHLIDELKEVHVPDSIIDELIARLRICLKSNFCEFNNEINSFPEDVGVPRGSPLGSTLIEVFMSRLETNRFTSYPVLAARIVCWYRYMDDVLCLWKGTADALERATSNPQQHVSKYFKFTVEFGGKMINFLPLTVSVVDNRHKFGMYRNETCTDICYQL